jgi:hypothetical protein
MSEETERRFRLCCNTVFFFSHSGGAGRRRPRRRCGREYIQEPGLRRALELLAVEAEWCTSRSWVLGAVLKCGREEAVSSPATAQEPPSLLLPLHSTSRGCCSIPSSVHLFSPKPLGRLAHGSVLLRLKNDER